MQGVGSLQNTKFLDQTISEFDVFTIACIIFIKLANPFRINSSKIPKPRNIQFIKQYTLTGGLASAPNTKVQSLALKQRGHPFLRYS